MIHLAISTCPNDTFAFAGILEGRVDCRGLDFRIELIDIEQLNTRVLAGEFDVAKTSFHAALHRAADLVVLPSGSALGFGVGPLLLSDRPGKIPGGEFRPARGDRPRTLCPGEWTTATMLMRLFHGGSVPIDHVVFSDIMPTLRRHEADFGVCIHEGRFTYRSEGLHLVEDLGTRWERETKSPLPLGGIVARRRLGDAVIGDVQAVIADSLADAHQHRDAVLPTMRRYAQAMDDAVLWKHVDLYVNEWTTDLGDVGRGALATLSKMAIGEGLGELEVWG